MSFQIVFHSIQDDSAQHTVVIDIDTPVIIGRDDPAKHNGPFIYLDSKVVSRAHAKINISETGKVYIQDTKSSSGTFLNSIRLSPPKTQSAMVEIQDGDFLQFGEDCEVNGHNYKCELFSNDAEKEFQQVWAELNALQSHENPQIRLLIDRITEDPSQLFDVPR
jgi:pSer/pThr/pTyr-binding forkhead associated (FHA) protein